MTTVKSGDTIKVHYTGTLNDGTVFDSSEGREPLEFFVGGGQLIAGFDDAVVGMAVGESKTITISADQAYGQHLDELVEEVDRSQFPPNLQLALGQQLQASQDDGQDFVVTVIALTDTTVTLDGNHPLAGKELTFAISVVEIAA
ncbi:MAG: peptidylprolyl isomerase [bacterium]